MFVEWYALKCFALGFFISGCIFHKLFKYRYVVKHFEIDRILEIKKPKA